MHRGLACLAILMITCAPARADDGPRFLNRTGQTVVKLQLAPVGSKAWGPDQCTSGSPTRMGGSALPRTSALRWVLSSSCETLI